MEKCTSNNNEVMIKLAIVKSQSKSLTKRNHATRGQFNYTTDLRGSVRYETTTKDSKTETYNYDVFGESIGKTPEFFGYTGKPFDPQTKMYNYGYRDYVPKTARFSTIDPIRDGANWFSYVGQDPVNKIDAWGLLGSTLADAGDDYANYWISQSAQRKFINKVESVANSLVNTAYTYVPDYRCDNFLEQVIKDSGGNVDSVLAGPATGNNVRDHIKNAVDKGLTTKTNKADDPNLPDGAYAVFMDDRSTTNIPDEAHAGLLIVKDKKARYIDNSTANDPDSVQWHDDEITSAKDLQSAYAYKSFYYVPIKKAANQ